MYQQWIPSLVRTFVIDAQLCMANVFYMCLFYLSLLLEIFGWALPPTYVFEEVACSPPRVEKKIVLVITS